MGWMEFVPRAFIDFEENCTKTQCKCCVATNYILAKAKVAGVIIGVRLGIVDHRKDNLQVFNCQIVML